MLCQRALSIRTLAAGTAAALALLIAMPTPAQARRRRRPKPNLEIVVREGKAKVGTEVLRVKAGETKSYFSAKTKMRHKRRSFTHRTHTILDEKGQLVTYDRWLDVKGATLRVRLFDFKGTWKKVEFAQNPKQKNKVATLKVKRPLVVLDQRSPTLLDMAIARFKGRTELNWVRADDLTSGTMKLEIERLVDGAGDKYTRYRLSGEGLDATVLRGPDRKAIFINTGWGFTGTAKGRSVPKDLKPAPDAGLEAPEPPADGAPKADKEPADPAKKAAAPAKKPADPAKKPADPAKKPAKKTD